MTLSIYCKHIAVADEDVLPKNIKKLNFCHNLLYVLGSYDSVHSVHEKGIRE